MEESLKDKRLPNMEEAVRFWSSNIKAMLTQKFGKDKVGHIVIIFPFGHDVSCSWISDARRHDVVKLLRKLADHIESPNAKIIRPN